MTPARIGQLIRRTRCAQGLRQDQLAGAAGVGGRFLVELEAGKATARIGKALAVLAALGCTLALEWTEGAAGGLARSGLDENALVRCAARSMDRARRLALTVRSWRCGYASFREPARPRDEVPKGANNPAIKNMC